MPPFEVGLDWTDRVHVSRKADYAVRSMAYLAQFPERRVLIAEIAQEVAAPRSFLSKIMKQLVEGELVRSQTGPGGGYQLTRPASKISFRDILELVEGPWNLVPCQEQGHESCLLLGTCKQVAVWDQIRAEMLDVLASYSLDGVKHDGPLDVGALPVLPSA